MLTTLSAFDALQRIGGDLIIDENAALTTLSGFDALGSIGGNIGFDFGLYITNNETLATVSGFSTLATITGHLTISNNPLLTTLNDFVALATVGENIFIQNNAALNTLSNFPVLIRTGGELFIQSNTALITLSSFPALTHIGKNLSIQGNDALTTLSGFDNLDNIGKSFSIQFNDLLNTISGFDNLMRVENAILIQNNKLLASCCSLLGIVDNTVTPEGATIIAGNAAGCSSEEEIKADCTTAPALSASSPTLTASENAGKTNFNVAANIPWRITKNDADNWIISISPDNGNDSQTITIAYEANADTQERSAVFTLIATDVEEEIMKITLTQAPAPILPPPPPPPSPPSPSPVLGLPEMAEKLRFFPNPAFQNLYIEGITHETNLIIRTFSGKTLLRTTLHQNGAIDLASLPQGVYLLTLQGGKEQITSRLVRSSAPF